LRNYQRGVTLSTIFFEHAGNGGVGELQLQQKICVTKFHANVRANFFQNSEIEKKSGEHAGDTVNSSAQTFRS
jgi:hypothetical protein